MAFKVTTYKRVEVLAFGSYFPVNNPQHDQNSKLVLSFKQGNADAITHFLRQTRRALLSHELDKTALWVATIPSSTEGKAHKGFPVFIRELAQLFNIKNPQSNLLYRTETKEPAHLGGDRSKEAQLKTLATHSVCASLRGKPVLIFDDITTTGNSMKAGIDLLLNQGIDVKLAIAMGKTSN